MSKPYTKLGIVRGNNETRLTLFRSELGALYLIADDTFVMRKGDPITDSVGVRLPKSAARKLADLLWRASS